MKVQIRINHQIKARELRVLTDDGENFGVISLEDAFRKAEELGLDLIEISPNAVPPVAKIMDYGKFQYREQKKDRDARAKSHRAETKSLQVKIGTGDKDLEIKANKASTFLKEGHRVKIDLFLPGRSKYFDFKFLEERLARILRLISAEYKVADPAKKSPKGLTIIIEKNTSQK
ncbi:MAG: translation initiation factor IF-3 [Candidatus Vogelbacteria bacterium]|nr:translation initiation factor IF-3 [Candidatus Vogelbacteria bacterium]